MDRSLGDAPASRDGRRLVYRPPWRSRPRPGRRRRYVAFQGEPSGVVRDRGVQPARRGDGLARAEWRELLARTPLAGDSHNLLSIDGAPKATHLRLRIYPDGGVARL